MQEITVSFVAMPDGCNGRTNGVDTIWINQELNPVEARCTIAHELVHVERGHQGKQKPSVERWVEYETARQLVTIDTLQTACGRGGTLSDIAFDLGVTPRVLMDRASILSDAEARYVGCDTCQACPVMAQRFRRVAA